MTFVKGKAGNPGGRPKMDPKFVAACTKAAPKALEYLIKLIDNSFAADSDRIKAATVIIERTYGKPAQSLDLNSDILESITIKLKK